MSQAQAKGHRTEMSLEQALQQQEAFRLKKVWAEQKGFLFGRKKLMKETIQRVLDFYCVLRCSICFIELTRFWQQNCMLGGNFRDQYDQQGDSFNRLQPTTITI